MVDDGGHSATMMNYTLTTLFQHPGCLGSAAVYAVEDMHTMAMCNLGYCEQPSQIMRPTRTSSSCVQETRNGQVVALSK